MGAATDHSNYNSGDTSLAQSDSVIATVILGSLMETMHMI